MAAPSRLTYGCDMGEIRPRIVFVCSDRHLSLGSTFMRAHQLIELISPELGDEIDLSISLAPRKSKLWGKIARRLWAARQPEDAIFFVTKSALPVLRPEVAASLKKRGGTICADYVDGDLDRLLSPAADLHIASSYQSERQLHDLIAERNAGGPRFSSKVHTILHGPDIRLANQAVRAQQDTFRMVYFGDPLNCQMSEALRDKIDVLNAAHAEDFEATFEALGDYSAHYCVRPDAQGGRVTKPFTKGMIAAACGAVPLVNRSVPDAEALLGADYPYFTEDDSDTAVEAAFAKMAAEFGRPNWTQALSATQAMAARVSAPAIAERFRELVKIARGSVFSL